MRLRGKSLRADAIMGDADEAQLQWIQDVPGFANAVPLMVFFHVLYNVRKHTRHFPTHIRKVIMASLIDMHFTLNMHEFAVVRDQELDRWHRIPELSKFRDYFIKQWLTFWRWQIFHTPPGYATTNNLRGLQRVHQELHTALAVPYDEAARQAL